MPGETKKDEILAEELVKLAEKLDKDPPVSEEVANALIDGVFGKIGALDKDSTSVEKVADTKSEN